MAAHPGSAVVSVDFEAAFQNVLRTRVRQAVAQHAPWCSEAAAAWYSGSAVHVLYDEAGAAHEITATRGVDQGCPLGAFLFAVCMRGPAETVQQQMQQADPDCRFYMYLDDGYLIVKPHLVENAVKCISEAFGVTGVALHPGKLKVWAANCSLLSEAAGAYYSADFQVLKRHLCQPGGLQHQGLPLPQVLPEDQPARRHNLSKEIMRLRSLTDRLVELVGGGLDSNTAMSMLRVYAGPASQHAIRSCWVSSESARDYDVALAEC